MTIPYTIEEMQAIGVMPRQSMDEGWRKTMAELPEEWRPAYVEWLNAPAGVSFEEVRPGLSAQVMGAMHRGYVTDRTKAANQEPQ